MNIKFTRCCILALLPITFAFAVVPYVGWGGVLKLLFFGFLLSIPTAIFFYDRLYKIVSDPETDISAFAPSADTAAGVYIAALLISCAFFMVSNRVISTPKVVVSTSTMVLGTGLKRICRGDFLELENEMIFCVSHEFARRAKFGSTVEIHYRQGIFGPTYFNDEASFVVDDNSVLTSSKN